MEVDGGRDPEAGEGGERLPGSQSAAGQDLPPCRGGGGGVG